MEEDAELSKGIENLEPTLDFDIGADDDFWDFDSNNLNLFENLSNVFDDTVWLIVY